MKRNKQATLRHALISGISTAGLIFGGIVGFHAEPHIPLVFGCMIAGIVAAVIGYSWDEILQGMIEGITQSLEAILILLLIGMLIGTWIASGTVPTMICYGLQLIDARHFLFASALICLIVSLAVGAWGTVGTVGLAFMGIGMAFGFPAPMVAGCIIAGAYCGEIISPLSDATNLTAAVVGRDVFSLTKKAAGIGLAAFGISEVIYLIIGLRYTGGDAAAFAANIEPLINSLKKAFVISPVALIPIAILAVCILVRLPAIPSMLAGVVSGMLIALPLQGIAPEALIEAGVSGFRSETGVESLDALLTAGGLSAMLNSISIIIIAMAFGGLMQHTGQMAALVRPVASRIHSKGGMSGTVTATCIGMNIILPDQYLGLSVPGQMYAEEYDRRGYDRLELSRTLLCGGAVTSPLIPWNTCGIFCTSILGVGSIQYLPYACFNYILPVAMIVVGFLPPWHGRRKRQR